MSISYFIIHPCSFMSMLSYQYNKCTCPFYGSSNIASNCCIRNMLAFMNNLIVLILLKRTTSYVIAFTSKIIEQISQLRNVSTMMTYKNIITHKCLIYLL